MNSNVAPVRGHAEGETLPKVRPPRPIRLKRPRSSIGTIASAGPYSRLRLDIVRRYEESFDAWSLIFGGGMSVRKAAAALGMSPTTAWRRAHWFNDQDLNRMYGFPDGPIPQQRGTRAVPRGRPIVLPFDAADVIRELLRQGHSLEDIAASKRTVPACVRDLAARVIDAKSREAA